MISISLKPRIHGFLSWRMSKYFRISTKKIFQNQINFLFFSREEKLKKHEGNCYQNIDALGGINTSLRHRSRTSYQGQSIFPTNKLTLKKDRDLLGMR